MKLECYIKEHLEHMLLRQEGLMRTKLTARPDEIDILDGMLRVLRQEREVLERGLSSWLEEIKEHND